MSEAVGQSSEGHELSKASAPGDALRGGMEAKLKDEQESDPGGTVATSPGQADHSQGIDKEVGFSDDDVDGDEQEDDLFIDDDF